MPSSRSAAIVFMTWLNYMPSVVLHGLEFRGIGAFETPVRIIAFPLMAACAIASPRATSGFGSPPRWPAFPPSTVCSGVIIFAIGVSIYGF